MTVENYIIELKSSLRSFDKRDLIDEVSIYKWVEIALKKFGGDITMQQRSGSGCQARAGPYAW